jgi:hypothetical protein
MLILLGNPYFSILQYSLVLYYIVVRYRRKLKEQKAGVDSRSENEYIYTKSVTCHKPWQ